MNKFFKLGLAFAACLGFTGLVQSAEVVTETRPIDPRISRVKLDGVVNVRIRQGSHPELVLKGDRRWLARTTTAQNGDTLNIDTEVGESRGHGMLVLREGSRIQAELTLPQLREVWTESVGSTDVHGFSGEELVLTLEGAGSMRVRSDYRLVTANLGGIGSMNIGGLNCDAVELNLRGAGVMKLSGRSKSLKADLGGLGGLDAQQIMVDNAHLDLSGLGNATINVQQSANLSLSGMGSVTVYGKPLNRKVAVDGLGKVNWK